MSIPDAVLQSLREGHPVLLVDDLDTAVGARLVFAAAGRLEGAAERLRSGLRRAQLIVEPHALAPFASVLAVGGGAVSSLSLKAAQAPLPTLEALLGGAGPEAFVSPGRLQVASARKGGLLAFRGHAEGALDLLKMADCKPMALLLTATLEEAAAACGPDPQLHVALGAIPVVAMTALALQRSRTEVLVEEVAAADIPSVHADRGDAGALRARVFRSFVDGVEHLALVRGDPAPGGLVRVHSECLTGDALGSLRCDCGDQLRAAIQRISDSPSGVLLYVRGHEGRGIGLGNKIRAYALQDQGLDTAEANAALGFAHDGRDYAVAADILRRIGFDDIRLLSNNPRKAKALQTYGVRVREELPLLPRANPHNLAYLTAKRDKLGHRLPVLAL